MKKIIFGFMLLAIFSNLLSCGNPLIRAITDKLFEGYTFTHDIGDIGPGSGIIFYRSAEGFKVEGYGANSSVSGYFASYTAHYLEAAPSNSDLGIGQQWGPLSSIPGVTTFTSLSDPLASAIGNGRKDTQIMIENPYSTPAVQLIGGMPFGGQNDWFLPSLGELNMLYQSGVSGISSGLYWSSSQGFFSNEAWLLDLSSGSPGTDSKTNSHSVRAIRAF